MRILQVTLEAKDPTGANIAVESHIGGSQQRGRGQQNNYRGQYQSNHGQFHPSCGSYNNNYYGNY